MKIGTLTFHRASNFGGALQCYALVTYLRNKGYEVEVVDYRSKAIDNAYRLFKTDSFKILLSSIKKIPYYYRLNKRFERFRSYFPISKQSYYNAGELNSVYDVLLIGSDQVWSKRINNGFDPVYWGNIQGKTKIISYAASMGTDHLYTPEENEIIKEYLKNFYAISVREDSLAEELSRLTDKSIKTVIDPTLLLSLEDYNSIVDTSNQPFDKYVLFYQMEYHPQSTDRVEEIAEQLGCNIVIVGGPKRDFKIPSKHYTYADIEVSEFLGLYKNATCVFSSSFHGTALSLAFQKDFYFFDIHAIDRARNLLFYVGALERMIHPDKSLTFSPVNHMLVQEKLSNFRDLSEQFIKDVLTNE